MATLEQVMTSAPLWTIGVVFFVAMFVCSWAGTLLRRLVDPDREKDTASEGYLLSAALALLGLLIAFTFSLALNRYDARRTMVVEEGNSMSTAWLRATLVKEPEGEALRAAIRGYADMRLKLPESSDPRTIEQASAKAGDMVWTRLRAALPRIDPPIGATLVNATTEMLDAAARRKAERRARIPGRVLDVVSLYALMSAGIIGYVLGKKGDLRHSIVSTLLFLLLSLALLLILDLDRPWSGSITVPQQPIFDAREAMH